MSDVTGSYKIIRKLGSGVYSEVYLVKNHKGEDFAAKSIDFSSSPIIEIDLLRRLRSPYIIKALDLTYINDKLYIIIPLGVSLDNLLGTLNEQDRTKAVFEVAQGLLYLEILGIAHCDTKPDNILYSGDKFMLIDLGVARYSSLGSLTLCQSEAYSSPEVMSVRGKRVNGYSTSKRLDLIKSEIWSFGMLCLDIVYNKKYIITTLDLERMIGPSVKEYVISKLGTPFDMELLDLIIDKLLVADPDKRSSFNDFVESSYFVNKGMIPEPIELPMNKISETPITNLDNFRPAFDWLLNVLSTLNCPNKCAFMVIDNFLYFWRIYMVENTNYENSLNFTSAIIVITYLVMGLANPISDIKPLMHHDDDSTIEVAVRLFIDSGGIISRFSLYDSLYSRDMLITAVRLLLDNKYINIPREEFVDTVLLNESKEKSMDRVGKDCLNFNYIYNYLYTTPRIIDTDLTKPQMLKDISFLGDIIINNNISRLRNYLSRGLNEIGKPVSYKTHCVTSYRSTTHYIDELLRMWNETVKCAEILNKYIDTTATLKIRSDSKMELYHLTIKIVSGGYVSKRKELIITMGSELDEILRAMYDTGYISDSRSRIL